MTLATAAPARTIVSLCQIATLAVSWRGSLRAQNKSPRTVVGYLEGVGLFDDFLVRMGVPRDAAHIRREHVEAFIRTSSSAGLLRQLRPDTDRCNSFSSGSLRKARSASRPS